MSGESYYGDFSSGLLMGWVEPEFTWVFCSDGEVSKGLLGGGPCGNYRLPQTRLEAIYGAGGGLGGIGYHPSNIPLTE